MIASIDLLGISLCLSSGSASWLHPTHMARIPCEDFKFISHGCHCALSFFFCGILVSSFVVGPLAKLCV
jgi:hypothetical protein